MKNTNRTCAAKPERQAMITLRFPMLDTQVEHWREALTKYGLSLKGMGNWEGRVTLVVLGLRAFPHGDILPPFQAASALQNSRSKLCHAHQIDTIKNSPT
jgi:hypothetical protein